MEDEQAIYIHIKKDAEGELVIVNQQNVNDAVAITILQVALTVTMERMKGRIQTQPQKGPIQRPPWVKEN
jgi:hypothetical protein